MPEELLLLLERVEKEGTGATAAYVCSMLQPMRQNNSSCRFLRQPGQPLAIAEGSDAAGQPQNALAITIPSQSTPTDLTPSALVAPGSLPISSLPARPNLPDDPVIPHNGFVTAEEGEKAFFHLLRKAGVDASWTWDQTMRTIITDPLYKALNTLAEKKAAWQKVIISKYAFLWFGAPTDNCVVPYSTQTA